MAARPIAEGLFTEGPEARLLGGRDRETGRTVFPFPAGADASRYERVALSPEGRLWSYTVQRFRPKTPYVGPGDEASFAPYAVGYVELAGEIIVESPIRTDDFAALKIGMPMRFTVYPFRRDADGTDVLTYGFAPAT
jgi:uncharacterized OB-fold protein